MQLLDRIDQAGNTTLHIITCPCRAIIREKVRNRDPGDPQQDHVVKCHDCGRTGNLRLLIKAYEGQRARDRKLKSDHAKNTGDPHHA